MDWWKIVKLPGDQRGQATVEYAILTGMTVALLAGLLFTISPEIP